MAMLVIALVIMGVFLYIFGARILGYFLSQDYDEAACNMASKKSESMGFESPIAAMTTGAGAAIGGIGGCAVGAFAGAFGGFGIGAGPGCYYGAGVGSVGGGSIGYIIGSGVRDINLFLDSGIVAKCGIVLPPVKGDKTYLAARLANASLWGCEFSKLSDKSRITLVRSMEVNVSDSDIAYADVKAQMDAIYDSYGVPAEKRCALIWRINDTPIDCGGFRLKAGTPTDEEIAAMASGEIKAGEPKDIRVVYCKDRFLQKDKSFVSIIGNITK